MKLDRMPPEIILMIFKIIQPRDILALNLTSTTFHNSFLAHEGIIIGQLVASIRRMLSDDLLHLATVAVYLRFMNAKVDSTANDINPTEHSERLIDYVERSFNDPVTRWPQQQLHPVDVMAIGELVHEAELIGVAREDRLMEGNDVDFVFPWKLRNPTALSVARDKLPILIFEICCQCVLRHGEVLDTAEETRLLDRVARVVRDGVAKLWGSDRRIEAVWAQGSDLIMRPGAFLRSLGSWLCMALAPRLRHAVRKVVEVQAIDNRPYALWPESVRLLSEYLSLPSVQASLENPAVLSRSAALMQRGLYHDGRLGPLDFRERAWLQDLSPSLGIGDFERMPLSVVNKLAKVGLLQSAQVVAWRVPSPLYRITCVGEGGSGDQELLFIKAPGGLRAVASLKTICQHENWTRLDEFCWIWHKLSAGIRPLVGLLRMGQYQSRQQCLRSLRGLSARAMQKTLLELQSYDPYQGWYPNISSFKSSVIISYAPNQIGKPGPWKPKPFVEEVRDEEGSKEFRAVKW
ncbi:hypothetical protein CGCSCA4_v006708 [Colletotrichum siamense]|uniref:F-box domain-containing protein n=1 Tax=Colletotrichum siamense TaxID=690259 RepID=A0A9P5K669_COLSI|nr:hypothetical protein CGCSCA4_v006708 [Colletotrichum siamense]KAF4860644.1 hypothetical protein CGCSCA2_v004996 [Colletotrichum siamense]